MAKRKANRASESEPSVHFLRGFDPRLIRDPIHFPSLAAVVRERLLKVWSRRHIRPPKPNQNRLVIDGIHREKLADAILELAHLRLIQHADLLVRPVEPPLMRLGIVRSKREPIELSRPTFRPKLI